MRCENCKDTLCSFRLTAGECRNYPNTVWPETKEQQMEIISTPNTEPISVYDLGRAGIGIVEAQYKKLQDAAKSLVEAVEGYICPKKGDKYVFRGEVLAKCNKLKQLLNETE